ncbi:MAG: peptide-methionine (S)-S-oxide reductase, partial [Cellvibrionaceae bacterium]
MFFRNPAKEKMPTQQQVLPGREDAILITNEHAVLKTPLQPPYPNGNEQI